MSPPKVVSPVIVNLRISDYNLVKGCPGVPSSIVSSLNLVISVNKY